MHKIVVLYSSNLLENNCYKKKAILLAWDEEMCY